MAGKSQRGGTGRSNHSQLTGFGLSSSDETIGLCSEWLARHAEQEKLVRRWQRLETRLIREHDWFRLSERDRCKLPESSELDAISARLNALNPQNEKLLAALPKTTATSTQGIISKLSVVLANIHTDESRETFQLVKSILRDMEASGDY